MSYLMQALIVCASLPSILASHTAHQTPTANSPICSNLKGGRASNRERLLATFRGTKQMKMTLPTLALGILISQGAMAAGDGTAALGGGVGGALGNIVGQQMGGSTGAAVGAGLGGAAGGAVGAQKGNKTEAAIGGGLGSAGGSLIGNRLGGATGSTIGAGVGGAAGGALGNNLADDESGHRSGGGKHKGNNKHKHKNKHD